MRLRNAFVASVLVLTAACFAQAAVTSINAIQVPQAIVPNTITNQINVDFEGNLRGQQMILELTAGSIYQDAANPGVPTPPSNFITGLVPSAAWDTFVSIGGTRSDAPDATQPVLVVGGAVDIVGGSAQKFDSEGLNIAWAPGTGINIPNGTAYVTSQITLSNDAVGTLRYFGSTGGGTGEPLTKTFQIAAGVIGGDTPGGVAPLVADLNFATTAVNEVVNLTAVDSQGDPDPTWSVLAGPTYTPGFGALPTAPGLGAATFSWNQATQAFQFNTAGATRGTYVWTGSATNATGSDAFSISVDVTQVPEPATFAMVGLALVGLVGVARRRS